MSDIDLSGGTSPSGTPAEGSTPVPLDPNALYSLPGFDTPLRGEQVKNGIMMQSDYTRSKQELVKKARELDSVLGQASEALEVMAALQENPQEALATLAQIYLGQNNAIPPPAAPQGQSQGVQPDVMQLLEQHLAPLRQQNEQLQAQLYGYMANNQLEREWKGLEGRDPRMASDPSLRARVSQVAAERRLPLDDAYKLATYEEVQQRAEQAAAEARTRVMRQFIPSLGGGSRPGDGGQAPPVDSNALFEKSYVESLKEMGYID